MTSPSPPELLAVEEAVRAGVDHDERRALTTGPQPSGNDSGRGLPARSRAVSRSASLLRLAVRPAPLTRIRSLPMPARPMLSAAVPTLLPPSRTDPRAKHASLHETRTRARRA